MQRSKRTNKTTHRSEWRSLLKKNLTGPTLLEMSGNRTTHPSELVGRTESRADRTVYLIACDCGGNVFLRKWTSGSKSAVGQQSAAGSDKRVRNKSPAIHCKVRPNRARTYHRSIPLDKRIRANTVLIHKQRRELLKTSEVRIRV